MGKKNSLSFWDSGNNRFAHSESKHGDDKPAVRMVYYVPAIQRTFFFFWDNSENRWYGSVQEWKKDFMWFQFGGGAGAPGTELKVKHTTHNKVGLGPSCAAHIVDERS